MTFISPICSFQSWTPITASLKNTYSGIMNLYTNTTIIIKQTTRGVNVKGFYLLPLFNST